MPAVSVTVAEAVKTYLAGLTLSTAFTPVRSYADWELALEDADTLHVDVVAVSAEQKLTPDTRAGRVKYEQPVQICVRKRFATADKTAGIVQVAKVDELVLLVQEIHESCTQQRLPAFTDAAWQGTKILVSPVREHLQQAGQFTGIVQITFLVSRQL